MENILIKNVKSSELTSKQFSREDRLDSFLNVASAAVIIGVGGIGGHVAEILGSCKGVHRIIIFDPDTVDITNLNRTVYSYEHVDVLKVQCIAEIIAKRNASCVVVPIADYFNKESVKTLLDDKDLRDDSNHRNSFYSIPVFDCRDDDFQDYDLVRKLCKGFGYQTPTIWRAAYNGHSITLDSHPEGRHCWGETGYTTIPSHSVSSRLVAQLIVIYACTFQGEAHYVYDAKVPLTFDIDRIMEHIHWGTALDKLIKDGDTNKVAERISHMLADVHKGSDEAAMWNVTIEKGDPPTTDDIEKIGQEADEAAELANELSGENYDDEEGEGIYDYPSGRSSYQATGSRNW